MEEVGKRLKGCIQERSKGFTSWVRFGDYSLQCLLTGIEDCERGYRKGRWSIAWEEQGRKYRMERRSNKAGSFLLCYVQDVGQKSFSITVIEGRGTLGGWQLFLGKLRNLSVVPKNGKPSRTSIGEMTKELRCSEKGTKSFVEVLRTETIFRGVEMRIEVEENEVGERLSELGYCIVGKWRGGSNPCPDLETVRNWGKFMWNQEGSFKVVQMGRGLLLLEFHSPKEAQRVL